MKSYHTLFLVLASVGFVLDQTSKYAIFGHLYHDGAGGEITVVDGLFKIEASYTHERWEETGGLVGKLRTLSGDHVPRVNQGALFGIGHGHNWLFGVVSISAALLIVFFSYRPSISQDFFLCCALGLILAGTLGNLYDRLVFNGVRDFVHWFIWDTEKNAYYFDWPVFNVADCCLVVGAGTLLIHAFFAPNPEAKQSGSKMEKETAVVQP